MYSVQGYVILIWYLIYNWWGSAEDRIFIVSNIAIFIHAVIFPLAILIFCLKNKIPSVLAKSSRGMKKDDEQDLHDSIVM